MVKDRKSAIKILESDINSFLEETKNVSALFETRPIERAAFYDILSRATKLFPDHGTFFETILENVYEIEIAHKSCEKILEIVKSEKEVELEIIEKKLFLGAEDKIKIAGKSFENEDYISTFNNLNSALELALKDILDIPTTITKINTSDIINIMVKHKVGPVEHLKEVQKHVLLIDNKIKHQGYNPTKIDSINAIKSMEDAVSHLRKSDIKITEEIRNKIYGKV